jgi:hypothetical protein
LKKFGGDVHKYKGANYPNALGHNDGGDLAMPLEGRRDVTEFQYQLNHFLETGNMVIMALSYAQKSGDISQLRSYVRILRSLSTWWLIRTSSRHCLINGRSSSSRTASYRVS